MSRSIAGRQLDGEMVALDGVFYHVLKLTLVQGSTQVATISEVELQLPRNEAFAQADQSKDRTEETRQVEGKQSPIRALTWKRITC